MEKNYRPDELGQRVPPAQSASTARVSCKAAVAAAILLLSMICPHAGAQVAIPLWPAAAPGALGNSTNDIPTLTAYLPEATNATGAVMVICPGGAYAKLSPREGRDYALWLSHYGITCFVLQYRLGSKGYRYPVELQDGARAVRWVRAHAADYKIDPHRVGMMGSSAGGQLTSLLATHFDFGDTNAADPVERQSSRPDIAILCYPVITMGRFTHGFSRANLIGTNPPPELVRETSSELNVRTNTPPCFLWTSFADKVAPMENSMLFAEALRNNHVPFELLVYENGKHGVGLGDKPPFDHPLPWANECLLWLKQHGWLRDS